MDSVRSFVAIDFETAQKKRASPIQIGVVRVIDGRVGQPFTAPVLPPPEFRWFDPDLQRIHGLTPADVEGAQEWDAILSRLGRFTMAPDGSRLPLVAHNASFERSVIAQTSAAVQTTPPAFTYYCTVKLSRLVDPIGPGGPPNHKLDTLAARYGIEQLHHHDAGDDA
ncbi:MAG: hypothetical protein B7X41_13240, partial [Microbacterium sp. 14-71-5]